MFLVILEGFFELGTDRILIPAPKFATLRTRKLALERFQDCVNLFLVELDTFLEEAACFFDVITVLLGPSEECIMLFISLLQLEWHLEFFCTRVFVMVFSMVLRFFELVSLSAW